jgi:hypothetical protein
MRKRRQINADSEKPTLRSSVAAATEPVREAAFAVERRVVWRGADRLHRVVEVARWPFERIAWTAERLLLWPVQERAAGRMPRAQAGGIAAGGAIVAGLAVLGIVLSTGGGGNERVVVGAAPAAVTQLPRAPAESPSGPLLHGAPPNLSVDSGVGVTKPDSGEAGADSLAAVGSSDPTSPEAGEATAGTSSTKPVPAGPEAMKVARRFAEAFVFYEVGERSGRSAAVFTETASAPLAEALSDRPPRLPAGAKLPKAKVLNLVPGPRRGRAYTVSVSLLRVGVTSELRVEMQKLDGAWTVTDVRG